MSYKIFYYLYHPSDSNDPDIVAPATEGTIKITKIGRTPEEIAEGVTDDTYKVEYELKDDAEGTKHTVKACWTGRIKIYESGFDE